MPDEIRYESTDLNWLTPGKGVVLISIVESDSAVSY